MNNKYIIDGVEYEYGEEVEVSDDNTRWTRKYFINYHEHAPDVVKIQCFKGIFKGNIFMHKRTFHKYIRKIKPTSYEGSSGRFIYGEQSLSGRKAKLILDGAEYTVTFG